MSVTAKLNALKVKDPITGEYSGTTVMGEASIALGITGANIGEFAKIKTVDENGQPTSWETGEGGGGQTDIGLSVVNGKICVTWEEI